MVDEALATADLARIVRQILDSEDKEEFKDPKPSFTYNDCYRLPWQGSEIVYRVAIMRGLEPCTVWNHSGDYEKITEFLGMPN